MNVLKSTRLHIGIFGKRNAGKSSLLNFIMGQNTAIVSDKAGTTTDPVEKVMELIPLGPVVLIDTAGIDDIGSLGDMRVQKTYDVINRVDLALIVCDSSGINEFEEKLINEFKKLNTPFGIIVNKNDIENISDDNLKNIKSQTDDVININTKNNQYLSSIKELIIKLLPSGFFDDEKILNDIILANDTVVQVIPIDKAAPKGRLILPQVRVIRNLLDLGANSVISSVENLKYNIENLKTKPKLVITDSQVFKIVSDIVPNDIKLTSYSILFARLKGDLQIFTVGAEKISELKNDDTVLICESCTHPTTCDDIGKVKIPAILKKFTNKNLNFVFCNGHDFPSDLKKYSLIIHCGGCMTNKKEILSRIINAQENQIPITNYGICIAYCLGILNRAKEIFEQ